MKKSTKYIIGIVAVLAIGGTAFALSRGGSKEVIQSEVVKKMDLKRTVLATGTVTSGVDLKLSFKVGGVVKKLPAKTNSVVKPGDILAELDNRSERASLLQAQGTLAQARANLQKVLDGVSNEDVAVQESVVKSAQVSLTNAEKNLTETKRQQQQLVDNAYRSLLNSNIQAVAKGSTTGTAPEISGTYTGNSSGKYVITFYQTGLGTFYSVSGLETNSGNVNSGASVPIGSKGLFAVFPANNYPGDVWEVEIPNTKASDYITNLNAYNASLETQKVSISSAESAVSSAKTALLQAEATLTAKKAEARPADVAVARAQVTSAQGQVESAQAVLENTIIRAPVGGTITKVDVKLGELANSGKEIITIQDIGNLYVEANISEANIASLSLNQMVEYTFDALGSDRKFTGKVTAIDPASTVVSGVVNYKVTASVDNFTEVRPGMTANMSVAVASRSGVLTVPLRAILTKDNGSKAVRVVLDEKKAVYEEKTVTTGLEADGGLVEIVSGLSEGQTIVTFVEKK